MNSLKRNYDVDDSQSNKRIMIIPTVKIYSDSIFHRAYYLVQFCEFYTVHEQHLHCHVSDDFLIIQVFFTRL